MRPPAHLPVLTADQIPKLDRRLRLEQVWVRDRLGAEEILRDDGRVVRALRETDVVHPAVGMEIEHQVRELIGSVIHVPIDRVEVRERG